MRYAMGEVRNRSVRLDDDNYEWLTSLPGRSLNDAVDGLRRKSVEVATDGAALAGQVAEILDLVRGLPDADDVGNVLREVVVELKGQKVVEKEVASPVCTDPTKIPGVQQGMPARRETGAERAIRERHEREQRARAMDSSGADRDDVDRGDDYVSN